MTLLLDQEPDSTALPISWPRTRTPASTCTSRQPVPPGSTRSNGGSGSSPTSSCAAAHTSPFRHWRKTSATGSAPGTTTHARSSGPRPPTRSSNASTHIFNGFPAQDT